MDEEIISKNIKNNSETTERPEPPTDLEEVGDGENADTMNRGREFPGERMASVAQPQADPMAPLIYFSAGAGSALLAFLVFYLCLRFLPKRGCDCHQKKTSKKG